MRLTAIILLFVCLHAAVKTSAQKISFSLKDVPVQEVLRELGQQGGISVVYNEKILEGMKKVSMAVKNATVKEVLDLLVKKVEIRYVMDGNKVLIKKGRMEFNEGDELRESSPIKLSGIVAGRDGKPLGGTTIRIKGRNNSVLSNENGSFEITANTGSILLISYVGFQEREFKVTNTGPVNIVMIPVQTSMDTAEVIVSTGYQELDKTRSTGSFVKVNNELFNRRVGPDIISRLDGITPGLLFDKRTASETKLQIRGLFTLSEQISQPLIVVDNFPYDGKLTDLNPNDIEDITILRDAAAASIWGARAGNGVIVLKTKKGKYGQAPQITVNSNVTFSKKTDLSDLRIIPSSDFIDLEKYLFEQGLYDAEIEDNFLYYPVTPVVTLLDKAKKNLITAEELNQQLNELRKVDNRKDFEQYLYRAQVMQQYSAAVSGGARNINYYFSMGYDKNVTGFTGNENDRISIRSVNTFQPLKSLQIQTGIHYSLTNAQNNNPGQYLSPVYSYKDRLLPVYQRIADDNGNPLSIDNKYKETYLDTVGNGQLLDWKYRPLQELQNNDKTEKSTAFLGTLNINYKLTRGISFDLQYQYSRTNSNTRDFYNTNTFFARDLINTFTNLNTTEPNLRNPVPVGGILDLRNSTIESHGGRGQININQEWGNEHQVAAIIGGEIRQVQETSNGFRSYGYTDKLSDSRVDYANRYPTLPTGFFTDEIPRINQPFAAGTDRFVSYYFNGSYTYLNKYVLSASIRKDASNIFGVKTNEKGRPFWSLGGSWNISGERFYKVNLFPYLRLRATYGYSGNIDPSVTARVIISYETAGANTLTNIPYAQLSTPPNPNLRWEKVGTLNTALDFASKNDRISGSIEYFHKRSTDVIYAQTKDPTTGTSYAKANSAVINGNGIDLLIKSKNIVSNNFLWETSLSLSKWIYKVERFDLETFGEKFFINNGELVVKEGYNPYTISSYRWAGLNSQTGDPQIFVGGKTMAYDTAATWLQADDIVYHGSNLPKYFGNMLNSFTWKGFSLSANITYRLGYYLRKPTINYRELFRIYRGDIEYLQRWKKTGDEQFTNVPSLKYPGDDIRDNIYSYADINIIKGDHIRLEDVRIGYSIDKSAMRKLPFDRVQIYGYINNINVLLWRANDKGFDPQFLNGVKTPLSSAIGVSLTF